MSAGVDASASVRGVLAPGLRLLAARLDLAARALHEQAEDQEHGQQRRAERDGLESERARAEA